jgi:hypothetical protein
MLSREIGRASLFGSHASLYVRVADQSLGLNESLVCRHPACQSDWVHTDAAGMPVSSLNAALAAEQTDLVNQRVKLLGNITVYRCFKVTRSNQKLVTRHGIFILADGKSSCQANENSIPSSSAKCGLWGHAPDFARLPTVACCFQVTLIPPVA